jgi:hypothetical protein
VAVEADQAEAAGSNGDISETQPIPPTRARRTIKLEAHDDDIPMEPGAVGARLLERGTQRPPLTALTPERIAVGAALLVLFIALIIILAGGGLV